MAAVDTAVDAAMRALEEATQNPLSVAVSTTDALAELAETWKGFVDVTIDVEGRVGSEVIRSDVVEVVNEAVANAHHHGQATTAAVSIREEADGIHVTVVDNGSTSVVGDPGLGTRLLRTASTSYNLAISPDGATLRVVLPHTAKNVSMHLHE